MPRGEMTLVIKELLGQCEPFKVTVQVCRFAPDQGQQALHLTASWGSPAAGAGPGRESSLEHPAVCAFQLPHLCQCVASLQTLPGFLRR